MVGVFVRLKARVLRNRLARSGWLAWLGFALVWWAAVSGGVLGAVLLGLSGRLLADKQATAASFFTLVFLGWLAVPLVAASLDETLEPRRFELLPLRSRTLAAGLLAAALAGPGGVATVLALLGGTVAGFPGTWGMVIEILAAATAVLLCVGSARLVTTLLADVLRRRRAHEVVAIVFALVAVLPALVNMVVLRVGVPSVEGVAPIARRLLVIVEWLPSGALGRSVALAASGRLLAGVALLGYGAAVTVTVVVLWGWALVRLQTISPASAPMRTVSSRDRRLTLYPRLVHLPTSPVGAAAAKELREIRRDVRLRGQVLSGAMATIVLGLVVLPEMLGGPLAPFAGVFVGWVVVASFVPNQFGHDGGSFWGYVVSSGPIESVLKGKNLAATALAGPPAVAVTVLAGLLARQLALVPAAICMTASVLAVWMGVGNLTSVWAAYPLPAESPFTNRSTSGTVMLYSLLGLAASGVVSAPVAAMVVLPALLLGPVWATVGGILGVAYGVTAYRTGLRIVRLTLPGRTMRLLETLDRA